jgi:hypothetical protein
MESRLRMAGPARPRIPDRHKAAYTPKRNAGESRIAAGRPVDRDQTVTLPQECVEFREIMD